MREGKLEKGERDLTDLTWHLIRSRSVKALFSVLVPGWGQLCGGKTVAAIVWLPAVILAYLASPYLGLAAHCVCAFDATKRHNYGPDPRDARISKWGSCVFGAMVLVLLVSALYLGAFAQSAHN